MLHQNRLNKDRDRTTSAGGVVPYVKASFTCKEIIKSGVGDSVEYILVEIYNN